MHEMIMCGLSTRSKKHAVTCYLLAHVQPSGTCTAMNHSTSGRRQRQGSVALMACILSHHARASPFQDLMSAHVCVGHVCIVMLCMPAERVCIHADKGNNIRCKPLQQSRRAEAGKRALATGFWLPR